ncbi:disulfide bond formation protein B [Thiocystis violascens]|uniref:Disulfide bond formation protein DsbB n=1 Tax=Thiocystis violascens (strain ATCC 17096 / DSM 198 / 6111) TaxID=765911 RepID=I3YBU7_THIV6|nr:disulfide bond formation protein B [Thiocystis violascens]AFL74465.1 disulfide bond formation protein DsbB [Thiocystis violascens DSM 198]
MLKIAPRPVWMLLAMLGASAALASLILTPWLNLAPCHLCIFQRLLFMLMALLATVAALAESPGGSRLAVQGSGLALLVLAAVGAGVAAYQSWLQYQPLDTASCVGGQLGPIERLIEWLGQQAPSLFLASGFCENRELVILGLSLANWAFFLFVLTLAVTAWTLWRGWHSPRATRF